MRHSKLLLLSLLLVTTICRPNIAANWSDVSTIIAKGWGATIRSTEKPDNNVDILHLRISGLSLDDLEFLAKCEKLESITILGTSLSPSELVPVLRRLPNINSIVVTLRSGLGPVIPELNWLSHGKVVDGASLKRLAVVGNASEVTELVTHLDFDIVEVVFTGREELAIASVFEVLQTRSDLVQLDIACLTFAGTPLQIPQNLMKRMVDLQHAGFTNCILPSASLPAQLRELKLVDSVIEGEVVEILRSQLQSIELVQMDESQIVASGFPNADPDCYGGRICLKKLDTNAMGCFRNWSCEKQLTFGASLCLNIDEPICAAPKKSDIALTEQALLDFANGPNIKSIEIDSQALSSVSGATIAKLNEHRKLARFGYAGTIESIAGKIAPIAKSSLTLSLSTFLSGAWSDTIRNSENLNLEILFPKRNIALPSRMLSRVKHFGVGFAKDSHVLADFLGLNVGEFTRTINLYNCEIDQSIVDLLVKDCPNLEKISLSLCYSEEHLSFESLGSLKRLQSIDLKASAFSPSESLLQKPGLIVRFGD